MRRTLEKVLSHLRKSLNFSEETVHRHLYLEDTQGEDSEGSEEHIIGNWRKGHPCYAVVEILAT